MTAASAAMPPLATWLPSSKLTEPLTWVALVTALGAWQSEQAVCGPYAAEACVGCWYYVHGLLTSVVQMVERGHWEVEVLAYEIEII